MDPLRSSWHAATDPLCVPLVAPLHMQKARRDEASKQALEGLRRPETAAAIRKALLDIVAAMNLEKT